MDEQEYTAVDDDMGPLIYHRYFDLNLDDVVIFVEKYKNLNDLLYLACNNDETIDPTIYSIKKLIGTSNTRKAYLNYYYNNVKSFLENYTTTKCQCENINRFITVNYCGQTISRLNVRIKSEDSVGSSSSVFLVVALQLMFGKSFKTRIIFGKGEVVALAKKFNKDVIQMLALLEWRAINQYNSNITFFGANIANPIN